MKFPVDEEWLELPVDPSYVVSTHGRLYDLRRRCLVLISTRRYTTQPDKTVLVWHIREARSSQPSRGRVVHSANAVLQTFRGPGRSPGYLDRNPANLRLQNLFWRYPA